MTTANGVPVDSAEVKIGYTYDFVQSVPLDTIAILVGSPRRIFSIDVFSPEGLHVRQLFFGYPPSGTLKHFSWDGTDDSGRVMASGKYLIRYKRDTTVLKIVPVINDDQVTALTDGNGGFTINAGSLPIGESFDFYRQDNIFDGVYKIAQNVVLTFSRASLKKQYLVTLQSDNIYHGVFTIQ